MTKKITHLVYVLLIFLINASQIKIQEKIMKELKAFRSVPLINPTPASLPENSALLPHAKLHNGSYQLYNHIMTIKIQRPNTKTSAIKSAK